MVYADDIAVYISSPKFISNNFFQDSEKPHKSTVNAQYCTCTHVHCNYCFGVVNIIQYEYFTFFIDNFLTKNSVCSTIL
jgi:hypothetical protein